MQGQPEYAVEKEHSAGSDYRQFRQFELVSRFVAEFLMNSAQEWITWDKRPGCARPCVHSKARLVSFTVAKRPQCSGWYISSIFAGGAVTLPAARTRAT